MQHPVSLGGDLHAVRSGEKPRILVVDDNADAANSLARLLTLLGNDVRVAHDGPSALAEIDQCKPRAVLLDLGMPLMNGFETAEQMRARYGGRDIALVAVTGWGQERDRQRTEAAGFVAHLIKPVDLDQLETVLRRIVGTEASSSASLADRPSSR